MPALIVSYIRGLVQGHRITATFLKREFGVSHDRITRMLQKHFSWKRTYLRLVHALFGVLAGGYLVLDDTVLAKPYGKKFAKAVFAYSSCLDKVVFGYHVVVLAWTNGIFSIPLSFRFYQDKRKTKIALAQELLREARYF